MKKGNVVNLIKYYSENNDLAFRNEAYEKFEILKGSIIVKGNKGNENVEKRNKRIIEELIENNLVEKDGNKYILKENYKVSSPSAAASLILGRNANDWKEWKTFDGKLLNEFRK